ncbi:MAG: hypothetical protein KDD82_11715 [Planctomycetes bacterium]|nr:hypothetical protein [Planctomycetota bacterium]
MKLHDFLQRIPQAFAIEMLEALPGPDRRELLRTHGARVKAGPGNLKRSARVSKEAKLLTSALLKSQEPDEIRSFLQGWLARRADMVVLLLDAWEIEHSNGIVEDFDWVPKLTPEKVKESLSVLKPSDDDEPILRERKEQLEPIAPLVYFAYLELPCSAEVLDLDAVLKSAEGVPAQA